MDQLQPRPVSDVGQRWKRAKGSQLELYAFTCLRIDCSTLTHRTLTNFGGTRASAPPWQRCSADTEKVLLSITVFQKIGPGPILRSCASTQHPGQVRKPDPVSPLFPP